MEIYCAECGNNIGAQTNEEYDKMKQENYVLKEYLRLAVTAPDRHMLSNGQVEYWMSEDLYRYLWDKFKELENGVDV